MSQLSFQGSGTNNNQIFQVFCERLCFILSRGVLGASVCSLYGYNNSSKTLSLKVHSSELTRNQFNQLQGFWLQWYANKVFNKHKHASACMRSVARLQGWGLTPDVYKSPAVCVELDYCSSAGALCRKRSQVNNITPSPPVPLPSSATVLGGSQ